MNRDTVENWLRAHELSNEIVTLRQTAATAQQAADALGCGVSQIAKSLIFFSPQTHESFLIITSGSNRVDTVKVGEYLGQKIKTAGPKLVFESTGFLPGAVPPVAHSRPLRTLFDTDLLQYPVIWVAAGDAHAVFSISPSQLVRLTSAKPINVH